MLLDSLSKSPGSLRCQMDQKKTLFTPFYKAARLKAFSHTPSEGRAQAQMCVEDANNIYLNQTGLGGLSENMLFFFPKQVSICLSCLGERCTTVLM